jgi:hypothetical protein
MAVTRIRESVLLELKYDLGTDDVFNAAKSRYMKVRNPMVKFTGVKVSLNLPSCVFG